MQFKLLSLAALATSAAAQSIQDVVMQTDQVSEFARYANMTGVLSTLQMAPSNMTLVVPNNQAFRSLMQTPLGMMAMNSTDMLRSILTYHAINGTFNSTSVPRQGAFLPTMLNGSRYENVTGPQVVEAQRMGNNVTFFSANRMRSNVTMANVMFNKGIIHIVDSVMVPPWNISRTASDNGLSALDGALTRAGLVNMLQGMTDVTVLAPTNMAFGNVAGGSGVSALSDMMLGRILQYHVIPNMTAYSTQIMNGTSVPTMAGPNVTFTFGMDGAVFANNARVMQPDFLTANGVVHVIDQVLNPNNTMRANSTASSGSPAFSGASSGGVGGLTSNVPSATTSLGSSAYMMPTATDAQPSGAAMASTSSSGLGVPMKTGAVGAAALFGAGAAFVVA